MIDFNQEFDRLDAILKSKWEKILSDSPLVKRIVSGDYDLKLYARYLIETYHYTRHNSRNQALVATRSDLKDVRYQKFCLHHAEEEAGHEYFALHDLKSIGFDASEEKLPAALPATEALIGYLYWISANGNPLQRLGYSYWAESVYGYIDFLLKKVAKDHGLGPSQMTFFVQHSTIDAKHINEVKDVIRAHAKTREDLLAIEQVMVTSLDLTAQMLTQVAECTLA